MSCNLLKEFLTNPQLVCKRKWDLMKSIANSPAIKHGRTCEPYAILDFERDHGKVTKCGLHISKAMPNFGNYHFVINYFRLWLSGDVTHEKSHTNWLMKKLNIVICVPPKML